MPRLVLLDDDGRELFSGQVSRRNVTIVAGFLRENLHVLRSIVAVKQAMISALDLEEKAQTVAQVADAIAAATLGNRRRRRKVTR